MKNLIALLHFGFRSFKILNLKAFMIFKIIYSILKIEEIKFDFLSK